MPASQTLRFANARQLVQLYCSHEPNLALAERKLGVRLVTRDDWLQIDGADKAVDRACTFFNLLNEGRSQGLAMRTPDFVRLLDTYAAEGGAERLRMLFAEPLVITTKKKTIVPKTIGQKLYLQAIQNNPSPDSVKVYG